MYNKITTARMNFDGSNPMEWTFQAEQFLTYIEFIYVLIISSSLVIDI
jgi:hypothetical protein